VRVLRKGRFAVFFEVVQKREWKIICYAGKTSFAGRNCRGVGIRFYITRPLDPQTRGSLLHNADFGLSKIVSEDDGVKTRKVGLFMSPEVFLGARYNEKCGNFHHSGLTFRCIFLQHCCILYDYRQFYPP